MNILGYKIVYLHNKYSEKSRTFINTIPTSILLVDAANGNKEPLEGMISGRKYLEAGGSLEISDTNGSICICVPAYNIPEYTITVNEETSVIPSENIPEHQEVIGNLTTWEAVQDYIDFVNQRAIDNPPV